MRTGGHTGARAEEHAAWRADFAAGETAGIPDGVRAEMEGCGECRREARELDELGRGIELIADDDREVVAGARKLASAPGEDEIEARLRGLARAGGAREDAHGRRGFDFRRHGGWALAAALALCLGALWLARRERAVEPIDEQYLGPVDSSVEMHPSAPGDDPASFSWTVPLPPDGSFRLVARSLRTGAVVIDKSFLREPRYTATADELAQLRDGFSWNATPVTADGVSLPPTRTVEFKLSAK